MSETKPATENKEQDGEKEILVKVSNIGGASSGYASAIIAAIALGSCMDSGAGKIASAVDKNTRAVEMQTSAILNKTLSCPRP